MSEKQPDPVVDQEAETLAAFIEDRLAAEEHALVDERLASDAEREAYLDALRVVRELEAGAVPAGGADVPYGTGLAQVPGRTGRGGWRGRFGRGLTVAVAAVLAVLVLAPWAADRLGAGPGYTPGVLVSALGPVARSASTMNDIPWRALRSPDALMPSERAFRLGVHHVQLESAALAGDHAASARLAGDMALLAAGLRRGSAVAAVYEELATLSADDPRGVRLRRQAWDALIEASPAAHARLGAWVAAARQAVLAGDVDWPRSRVSLEARATVNDRALSPGTREAWDAARPDLDGDAEEADARRLLDALDAVLRAGAG
jgi:hypothetical protein